jgi:hypothetical protein
MKSNQSPALHRVLAFRARKVCTARPAFVILRFARGQHAATAQFQRRVRLIGGRRINQGRTVSTRIGIHQELCTQTYNAPYCGPAQEDNVLRSVRRYAAMPIRILVPARPSGLCISGTTLDRPIPPRPVGRALRLRHEESTSGKDRIPGPPALSCSFHNGQPHQQTRAHDKGTRSTSHGSDSCAPAFPRMLLPYCLNILNVLSAMRNAQGPDLSASRS